MSGTLENVICLVVEVSERIPDRQRLKLSMAEKNARDHPKSLKAAMCMSALVNYFSIFPDDKHS